MPLSVTHLLNARDRHIPRIIATLAVIAASTAPSASAGWSHVHAPFGGQVTAFAEHTGSLYAIERRGVYQLDPAGTTWTPAFVNSPAANARALFSSKNVLFAATDNGVFVSHDSGATWQRSSLGGSVLPVFASTDSCILAAGTGGIYRSFDNGITWIASATNPASPSQINAMVRAGSMLLAGSTYHGILQSSDDGRTWSTLPDSQNIPAAITALTYHNGLAYAGTQSGLWVSPRAGSWARLSLDGLDSTINDVLALDDGPYVCTPSGILFRSNSGVTWSKINDGFDAGDHTNVNCIYLSSGRLFAGTQFWGAYETPARAVQWVALRDGMTGVYVHAMAHAGSTLLAGTWGAGVYRSTDGGSTWSAGNSPVINTLVQDLCESPGTTLLAANSGVYVSSDAGGTWTVSNGSTSAYAVIDVGGTWIAGSYADVLRSTDRGATWTSVPVAGASVRALATAGGMIYAGTNGDGVYTSIDDGVTWTQNSTGLGSGMVNVLFANGTVVYAGTNAGIYATAAGAADWSAQSNGMSDLQIMSIASADTIVYAGSFNGTVYRSKNHGAKWNSVFRDSTSAFIASLLVDHGTLFASTYGNSVWQSPLAELTGVPEVAQTPATNVLISIAPEPVRARAQISLNAGAASSSFTVVIGDALGREVLRAEEDLTANELSSIPLDLSRVPAGMYVCRILTRGVSGIVSSVIPRPFIVIH